MSLGSVLLQPQALAAAQRALDERAPNALLDLLTRLATELASGGPALQIVEDEFVSSFESLAAEVEPRLQAARARLDGLIEPVFKLLEDTLGKAADGEGFERAINTGQSFTDALATALGGLNSARLGEVGGTLFDAIETDLGLDEARARAFLSGTVDRIVTRLQADYLGGTADATAYNRFALGAALREVVAFTGQDLDLPALNRTTLLPALVERLQSLNMDARIGEAQGAARRVSSGLGALKGFNSFLPGQLPSIGPEPVTSWYAGWIKDSVVAHPDPTNNPDLQGVDFGSTFSARTMEDLAHVSAWVARLTEMGLHLRSIQQGDFVSNVVNAVWQLIEAGIALFANADPPRWAKFLVAGLWTGLGGLERARFNDWFGLLLILSDMAETQLYARWTWLGRELLLSIPTLANNKRGQVNNQYIEGVAHAFGELGNLLTALILAKAAKRDFGIPAVPPSSWPLAIGFLMIGIGTNIFLTLVVGALVASAIAGKGADAGRVFRMLLKDRIFGRGTGGVLILQTLAAIVVHITDFYIYYFMFADGDTSGGKLTGKGKEQLEFPGYPDRGTSPYRLPWAKGKLYQCAQGNHGLWSHTPFGILEMYAFDWSFDDGDEVLAMRDAWSGTSPSPRDRQHRPPERDHHHAHRSAAGGARLRRERRGRADLRGIHARPERRHDERLPGTAIKGERCARLRHTGQARPGHHARRRHRPQRVQPPPRADQTDESGGGAAGVVHHSVRLWRRRSSGRRWRAEIGEVVRLVQREGATERPDANVETGLNLTLGSTTFGADGAGVSSTVEACWMPPLERSSAPSAPPERSGRSRAPHRPGPRSAGTLDVWLGSASGLSVAPGDAVILQLGLRRQPDDRSSPAPSTSSNPISPAARPRPDRRRETAPLRVNQVYENQSAGQIVSDLASQAGAINRHRAKRARSARLCRRRLRAAHTATAAISPSGLALTCLSLALAS